MLSAFTSRTALALCVLRCLKYTSLTKINKKGKIKRSIKSVTVWKPLSKVSQFQHNETLHEKKTINPLHPNISIYILCALFFKFPFILSRRIHLTIKASQVDNYPSYPHDLNE